MFLRGEVEDCSDCHTSGATAAEIDCDGLVSSLRMTVDMLHPTGKPTIARCWRHQAAKRESGNQTDGKGVDLLAVKHQPQRNIAQFAG